MFRSWLDLLYPPLCLHCQQLVQRSPSPLCEECINQLQLLDSEGRCPDCFAEGGRCTSCTAKTVQWNGVASAFDYFGPAATLVKQLKYSGRAYIARGLAAYLVAQFVRLNWPMPDAVIPVPMSRSRRMTRAYNHSYLLAQNVGLLLDRPTLNILCRRSGGFTQAGLSFAQRSLLKPRHYALCDADRIENKIVLLIDDVYTTGTTLKCSTEALINGNPQAVYALTICRTSV